MDRELSNILSSGEITAMNLGGTTTNDKVLKQSEVVSLIEADLSPKTQYNFTGVATPPSFSSGRMYYDNVENIVKIQGAFAGAEVAVGHGMHMHVENNSGALIEKGSAITQTGVIAGKIQIKKAIADTFDNARLLGIAAHDIANGSEGAAQTFGEITDFDTSSFPTGVPLYLSDTVAGTFTATAPDIVTRVGGVTVSDATSGVLFVYIINNKSLPQVFGGMQGQTAGNETYSVTSVAQDILNYEIEDSIVLGTNLLNGEVTLSNDGEYRMNFSASITFPSSTSTRTLTIDFFDAVNAVNKFSYIANIPRDAVQDGIGFNFPVAGLTDGRYKMRVSSNTPIAVTFDFISFDIQSINIR